MITNMNCVMEQSLITEIILIIVPKMRSDIEMTPYDYKYRLCTASVVNQKNQRNHIHHRSKMRNAILK